jgi:UDP-N-acetylglucosamine:LPS N-acetylglucosamine transferase
LDVERLWAELSVRFVPDFNDVVAQADVYITDNSSTLFEAAACGIPVVVLNGAKYRPTVRHGLRFWHYADIGVQVFSRSTSVKQDLMEAVRLTVTKDPKKDRRREIVKELFDGGESAKVLYEKLPT